MTYDVMFHSDRHPDGEMVSLACGFISLTTIAFVEERIAVRIEAKTGDVTFCDMSGQLLLSARVKSPAAGDETFSDVHCAVKDGCIRLGFPRYTYTDHYPHCDGEHDRWTKSIAGFTYWCYDVKNNGFVPDEVGAER